MLSQNTGQPVIPALNDESSLIASGPSSILSRSSGRQLGPLASAKFRQKQVWNRQVTIVTRHALTAKFYIAGCKNPSQAGAGRVKLVTVLKGPPRAEVLIPQKSFFAGS
jgi:hypothetical protein